MLVVILLEKPLENRKNVFILNNFRGILYVLRTRE